MATNHLDFTCLIFYVKTGEVRELKRECSLLKALSLIDSLKILYSIYVQFGDLQLSLRESPAQTQNQVWV